MENRLSGKIATTIQHFFPKPRIDVVDCPCGEQIWSVHTTRTGDLHPMKCYHCGWWHCRLDLEHGELVD